MTAEQQGSDESGEGLSEADEEPCVCGTDFTCLSGEHVTAQEGVLRYAEERYAERIALGTRGASDLPDLNPAWCLLPERSVVLCRTCMRPLTWEARTEPGYLPREGWYDDARTDPLICFKSADYRHIPLTDREWAYYRKGAESAEAALATARRDADELRAGAESIAYEHAATIDGEFGCCHDEDALRAGGRVGELDGDEFEPIPGDCLGKKTLDRHLASLGAALADPSAAQGEGEPNAYRVSLDLATGAIDVEAAHITIATDAPEASQ